MKRLVSMTGIVSVLVLLPAVALTAPVVLTLEGVAVEACDMTWQEGGYELSFVETTVDDCDGGGSCSFGVGETGVMLYPSRLQVDLGAALTVSRVEVDVTDWCGPGCTKAFLYHGETKVAAAENGGGSGGVETLSLLLVDGLADRIAVSSCEGGVEEIRIHAEGGHVPDCETDSDCGSFQVCQDGVCVEWVSPDCETDGDCGSGQVCVDGVCKDPEGPACSSDADCPDGQVCGDGECVTWTPPECEEDGDCDAGCTCMYGACMSGCQVDGDCDSGQACVDGACVAQDGAACGSDADCQLNHQCVNGACLPGCETDEDCGEGFTCQDAACLKKVTPGCQSSDDCQNGFICEGGVCTPPSMVTSDVVDSEEQPEGEKGEGGGSDCAVSDTPSGSALLLLLFALALLVIARRGGRSLC